MSSNLDLDPQGDVVLVLNGSSTASANPNSLSLLPELGVKEPGKDSIPQSRVRASSAHLRLASTVFKALLNGSFREGFQLRASGHVEVPLPDDYPDGLLVILYILHCRFDVMPKKITPNILMQVVLLADKYDVVKILTPFAQTWLADVRSHIPKARGSENLYWITIFKVLRFADNFKKFTAWELAKCTERLSAVGLPIAKVLGKALSYLSDLLRELICYL